MLRRRRCPAQTGHRAAVCRAPEEVARVLKKLAVAALRKRSGGRSEADLWHEATSGPEAVSTPTSR